MPSDLILMVVGYSVGSGSFLVYHSVLEIFKARRSQRLRKVILRRLELEPEGIF
ncbi:MAG: hypothetical protein QME75_05675 [Deltaproteobacteria bacterium]|nr:hypothetical protein [Deltaproteobacteria bacterium]